MQADDVSQADRDRVPTLHAAFAASPQLQAMFASRDVFTDHMLKAQYDSTPAISAEFPTVESFRAYAKWAARQE
jgi:hypothetical protein